MRGNGLGAWTRAVGVAWILVCAICLSWSVPVAFASPTGSIDGTVTNGIRPIAGVSVTAYIQDVVGYWHWAGSAETTVSGAFEIGALEPGSYRIRLVDPAGTYITEFYNDASSLDAANLVEVFDGSATAIDCALTALNGSLGGSVAGPDGPIDGIAVSILGQDESAVWQVVDSTVTAGGSYAAELPPGAYRVRFSDPSGQYLTEYFAGVTDSAAATDVIVVSGALRAGVDATLAYAGHIRGTVTERGAAASGIHVDVRANDGQPGWESVASAITTASGGYDAGALPTGSYLVRFTDPGGARAEQYYDATSSPAGAVPVTVAAGVATEHVDGALESGHITGTVRSASGPLEDISVEVCAGQYGVESPRTATTGPDGTFDVGGLPTNDYSVRFRDPTGVWASSFYSGADFPASANRLSVVAGSVLDSVDATLEPAGHIAGTILDVTGGAAGIQVKAFRTDGPNWAFPGPFVDYETTCTAEDGTYDLGGLPTGYYHLELSDADSVGPTHLTQYYVADGAYDSPKFPGSPVTVAYGAVTSVDATAHMPGSISGTLTAGANPVAGARLSILGPWGFVARQNTYTDEHGAFRFEGLAPGDWGITSYDSSLFSWGATIHVGEGEAVAYTGDASGHIRGIVTDGSAPVAGVQVDAYSYGGRTSYGELSLVHQSTAVSAGDGTYDLAGLATYGGSYYVHFADPSGRCASEYYSHSALAIGGTEVGATWGAGSRLDVALLPAGSLSGTVSDGAGRGLSGVRVQVYQRETRWNTYWVPAESTLTASDGSYTVGHLLAGTYRVSFHDPSDDMLDAWYEAPIGAGPSGVAVAAGADTGGIDQVLSRTARVRGRVVDGAGPLSGVRVDVCVVGMSSFSVVRSTVTTADGSWEVAGLTTGGYKVLFTDPLGRYVSEAYPGVREYESDLSNVWNAGDVAAVVGTTVSGIDARMDSAYLTGTVTDGIGPVEGVTVTAYRSIGYAYDIPYGWPAVATAVTGPDGTYRLFHLRSGLYQVDFHDPSSRYFPQYYGGSEGFGGATRFGASVGATSAGIGATMVAPAHIRGTVTDGASPLDGIEVTALQPDGAGGWNSVATTSSRFDGRYDIGGLHPGCYRLAFLDPSGLEATEYFPGAMDADHASDLAVSSGETRSGVSMTIGRPAVLTGQVNDDAGAAGGIDVTAYRADGAGGWYPVTFATTDEEGSFEIGGMPHGTYRVRYDDPSGLHALQFHQSSDTLTAATDIVASSGETVSIAATLSPGGAIAGRVTSGRHDLAGITAVVYHEDTPGSWNEVTRTVSAADGAYSVAGLAAGTYRLEFVDPAGRYLSEWFADAAAVGEAADVSVTPPSLAAGIDVILESGHVTGTVTGVSGPISGVVATAYRKDGSGTWQAFASSPTTLDGTFDVEGLPSDVYRVGFGDPGGTFMGAYFEATSTLGGARDVAVTSPSTVGHVDAVLTRYGHITGIVTNGTSPLAGIAIWVFRPGGSSAFKIGSTGADGRYDIGGLPTGPYDITFADPSRVYERGYASVSVTAGSVLSGIDKVLVLPDTTQPSTTCDIAYGGIYWNTVTAHFTAVDNVGGSGIASIYYRTVSQGDAYATTGSVTFTSGGLHYLEYWSVDRAGNSEFTHHAVMFAVGIDTTPPVTTSNAAATYAGPGTITLASSDGTGNSGVSGIHHKLDGGADILGNSVSFSALGQHTLEFWAADNAGNVEAHRTVTFSVNPPPVTPPPDTTRPVTISDAVASYLGAATIHLVATDNAGGSGVANTYFRLDGAPQQVGTAVTASGLGAHTLEFWSADNAGNVEVHETVTFSVSAPPVTPPPDTTRPVTISDAVASYLGAATIHLVATDNAGGSGVANTYFRLDGAAQQVGTAVTASGLGAHTLEFWSADNAGNVEVHETVTFSVSAPPVTPPPDTTRPVTISDAVASYLGAATIHLVATDNAGGSGVANTYFRLDGAAQQVGTVVPASGLGAHSLEFWSVDQAGNAESHHTTNFTIAAPPVLDTAPPTTLSDVVASYAESATINLFATDAAGGSGVAHTFFRLDGALSEGVTIAVSSPGAHTLQFWSEDHASNCETPHVTTFLVTAAKATASLSIRASRSSVRRGQKVNLSGTCKPVGMAGQMVTVQMRAPGSRVWKRLTSKKVARKTGVASWSYSYTVKRTARKGAYLFRVVYTGSRFKSSTSKSAKVTAK